MPLLKVDPYLVIATLAYSSDGYECLGANWFATNHVRKGLAFLTIAGGECGQQPAFLLLEAHRTYA